MWAAAGSTDVEGPREERERIRDALAAFALTVSESHQGIFSGLESQAVKEMYGNSVSLFVGNE